MLLALVSDDLRSTYMPVLLASSPSARPQSGGRNYNQIANSIYFHVALVYRLIRVYFYFSSRDAIKADYLFISLY